MEGGGIGSEAASGAVLAGVIEGGGGISGVLAGAGASSLVPHFVQKVASAGFANPHFEQRMLFLLLVPPFFAHSNESVSQ